MRIFLVIACMLVSSVASAFSGSLTSGLSLNPEKDKFSDSVGLSMSHPLAPGIAWWSWTGTGFVFEGEKDSDQWAQVINGVDFTLKNVKLTPIVKFNAESNLEDKSVEFGIKSSFKLW